MSLSVPQFADYLVDFEINISIIHVAIDLVTRGMSAIMIIDSLSKDHAIYDSMLLISTGACGTASACCIYHLTFLLTCHLARPFACHVDRKPNPLTACLVLPCLYFHLYIGYHKEVSN